jgi:hypothetical protein
MILSSQGSDAAAWGRPTPPTTSTTTGTHRHHGGVHPGRLRGAHLGAHRSRRAGRLGQRLHRGRRHLLPGRLSRRLPRGPRRYQATPATPTARPASRSRATRLLASVTAAAPASSRARSLSSPGSVPPTGPPSSSCQSALAPFPWRSSFIDNGDYVARACLAIHRHMPLLVRGSQCGYGKVRHPRCRVSRTMVAPRAVPTEVAPGRQLEPMTGSTAASGTP